MEAAVTERDYTGVATAELAAVYERNADSDLRTFAARIGMDESDLKKIVVWKKYPFTGLAVADKIVLGLGLMINSLVDEGELHIIPARGSETAARRMVEDEIVLRATAHIGTMSSARMTLKEASKLGLEPLPTKQEIDARVMKLLAIREELAAKSPEQEAWLRKDSERASQRLARKRQEARDSG